MEQLMFHMTSWFSKGNVRETDILRHIGEKDLKNLCLKSLINSKFSDKLTLTSSFDSNMREILAVWRHVHGKMKKCALKWLHKDFLKKCSCVLQNLFNLISFHNKRKIPAFTCHPRMHQVVTWLSKTDGIILQKQNIQWLLKKSSLGPRLKDSVSKCYIYILHKFSYLWNASHSVSKAQIVLSAKNITKQRSHNFNSNP